jgi:DNA modification methylase
LRLLVGDNRESLKKFPDGFFDSCVTDPPYELTSINERYSGAQSMKTNHPVYERFTRGFMGLGWDGTGIAFEPAFWIEVLRVLKPGAFLLAFGGSRTYHRLACAIEDGGFEIRDQIQWLYGSGFPKSLDCGGGRGTALKPAHEPIVMARKNLIGTVAANLEAHGTGALNIDASRTEGGRWPANVIHDGSDEVLEAFPDALGQLADAVTDGRPQGNNVYGPMKRRGEPSQDDPNEGVVGFKMRPGARRGDSGSAARFFYCAKASKADREDGCDELPVRSGGELTGRVDGSDGLNSPRAGAGRGGGRRNTHPTVKPTALMRYLVRLVTPPGGVVLDPFMGSGSTGRACALEGFDFVGMELSPEYTQIAAARIQASLDLKERAA